MTKRKKKIVANFYFPVGLRYFAVAMSPISSEKALENGGFSAKSGGGIAGNGTTIFGTHSIFFYYQTTKKTYETHPFTDVLRTNY